jgi:hypothetical protein
MDEVLMLQKATGGGHTSHIPTDTTEQLVGSWDVCIGVISSVSYEATDGDIKETFYTGYIHKTALWEAHGKGAVGGSAVRTSRSATENVGSGRGLGSLVLKGLGNSVGHCIYSYTILKDNNLHGNIAM